MTKFRSAVQGSAATQVCSFFSKASSLSKRNRILDFHGQSANRFCSWGKGILRFERKWSQLEQVRICSRNAWNTHTTSDVGRSKSWSILSLYISDSLQQQCLQELIVTNTMAVCRVANVQGKRLLLKQTVSNFFFFFVGNSTGMNWMKALHYF